MNTPKEYIYQILSVLFTGLLMSSCVYDDIEVEESDNPTLRDGYSLALTIDLPVMDTRAEGEENWEEYENYVKDFSLLFFKASDGNADLNTGKTLIRKYDSNNLSFFEVENGSNAKTKQWYVRIPIDPTKEGDADFVETIRENDFKIAVLANWPKAATAKIEDIGNINDLHRLSSNIYPEGSLYSSLAKDDRINMGATSEWVMEKKFNTKDDATSWIRGNWNPSLGQNQYSTEPSEPQYRDYKDLWFLWNFGGGADDNALPYRSFSDEWKKRNGEKLHKWLTSFIDKGEEEGEIKKNFGDVAADDDTSAGGDSGIGDGSDTGSDPDDDTAQTRSDDSDANGDSGTDNTETPDEQTDINSLHFTRIDGAIAFKIPKEKINNNDDTSANDDANSDANTSKYYYGVRLPANNTPETSDIDDQTPGVFSFIARASGTLYVTARPANATNSEATITAQVGNSGTQIEYSFGSDITTKSQVISITGDEQWVYIYNSGKDPVEIFQIEYIQDEYLYETDRTGVKLSVENPIPMYGIQEFKSLGEYWVDGTVFDLSNFNKLNPDSYEVSPIQLLRSVAKVELLLPKDKDAEFNHVFLRNMNRTAFCEPMDVASSTSDIWKDTNSSSIHWNDNCEWSKLIGLDPFYTGSKGNGHAWSYYQNKLSWYYGSWGKPAGDNLPNIKNGDFEEGKYPQILNPHINRSDFVEFLETGEKEVEGTDYNRYVLYVPEKFVDDPDFTTTDESWQSKAAPKLCHIEFRAANDPYYNLDDNNCYRIYFTNGGFYSKGNAVPPTLEDEDHLWENTYENDPEILKNHWTIMRNHIYTFTVSYKPGGNLAVQVKVLPWKRREVEVNW